MILLLKTLQWFSIIGCLFYSSHSNIVYNYILTYYLFKTLYLIPSTV